MTFSARLPGWIDAIAGLVFAVILAVGIKSLICGQADPDAIALPDGEPSEAALASARMIYDAKLSQYRAMTSDVRSLLYLMLVTSGVTFYVLRVKPTSFKLPFLDFRADAVWLRGTLPLVLAYCWLHFGYALYTASRCRAVLENLVPFFERGLPGANELPDSIADGGIVDFFFYLTSTAYQTSREASSFNVAFSWGLVILFYCGLLGLVHACILRGARSFVVSRARAGDDWAFLVLLALLPPVLVGSHFAFAEKLAVYAIPQLFIALTGAALYFALARAERARADAAATEDRLLLGAYRNEPDS